MNNLINKTIEYVRETLAGQDAAHDWWHIERVWTLAKRLATEEKADMLVVELAALLHDIGDYKLHDGDASIGPQLTRQWLDQNGVDAVVIDKVVDIVAHQSYSSSIDRKTELSLEGKVVQDADRLDAIGAIGIARTMAYVGKKAQAIHDPTESPTHFTSTDQYRAKKTTAINHFYEKLLLLKDKMNTQTAKNIAEHRHAFMEQYLEEFYAEWKGEQ